MMLCDRQDIEVFGTVPMDSCFSIARISLSRTIPFIFSNGHSVALRIVLGSGIP